MKKQIDEVLVFLRGFAPQVRKTAIKELSLAEREERVHDGWLIWTEPAHPGPPYEWKKAGDIIYYRIPPRYEPVSQTSKKHGVSASGELSCPWCGEKAFPQPVCPNCSKGKAGLKKQVICGDNPSHVFFTE